MVQAGRELNLAPESLRAHAGSHLGWQGLHDHGAPERHLLGDEHSRHATSAELAEDGVFGAERGLQPRPEVGRWCHTTRSGDDGPTLQAQGRAGQRESALGKHWRAQEAQRAPAR